MTTPDDRDGESDTIDPNAGDIVRRLIGVYDADGTLWGEASYWVGARFGRRHCSLCEVTHGLVRTSTDWKRCRSELPVAFVTYHRNDQPDAVRDAAGNGAPAVVIETDRGVTLLLDDAMISRCEGSAERLRDAIDWAVNDRGLRWPSGDGAATRGDR